MQSTVTETEGLLCSWVDNWFDDDVNFQRNWIRQHASDGGFLGKPVRIAQSSTPGTTSSRLHHTFTLLLQSAQSSGHDVLVPDGFSVPFTMSFREDYNDYSGLMFPTFHCSLMHPGAAGGVREVDQGWHQC